MQPATVIRSAMLVTCLGALTACNSTSQRPAVTPAPVQAPAPTQEPATIPGYITPSDFKLPQGAGCSGDVARFQAVQDNDLRMGHVNPSVYQQIKSEIAAAAAACSAGRDGEASSMIRASKSRHGYP